MNTYRAVHVEPNTWAIEWSVYDDCQGLVPGRFDTETEAMFNSYELARLGWAEAPREMPER